VSVKPLLMLLQLQLRGDCCCFRLFDSGYSRGNLLASPMD